MAIYLRDHAAVSAAAVALARRAQGTSTGTPFGRYAESLAAELERYDQALVRLMQSLGVRPGRLRRAGARLGERAGRLKLNGRLLSKSPLSPVVEAEALLAVVGAHLLVWTAVAQLAELELPPGVDAQEIAGSARARLRELEEHRLELLRAAIRA